MSNLLQKIIRNSRVENTSELSTANEIFNSDEIATNYPIINIAFSGSIHGGYTSGLTMLAGPSRNFKSGIGLICMKAFLDKYDDGIALFYNSEGGVPQGYLENIGIDQSRVVHTFIKDIEELKLDMVNQLENIDRSDKLFILIDSIGNLASKKEMDDAIDGKSVADMSRAKGLKSLFRIITPLLVLKDIPCIAINHVYQEMGMFPKTILGGGQGGMLSSNTVLFMSRSQEKSGNEISGYNFNITVEKSRFIREKSKLSLTANLDEGINMYSGLLELAIEGGFIDNSSKGWYSKVNKETGEIMNKVRAKDTNNEEFWDSILNNPNFDKFIKDKYRFKRV